MPEKQILVVDDDTDLSYVISDMLGNYGYSVTCAEDSDTAFSLLTNHTYHLILMDINLLRSGCESALYFLNPLRIS